MENRRCRTPRVVGNPVTDAKEIEEEKGMLNYRIPASPFLESLKLQVGRVDYRPPILFVTFGTWDFPKLRNVSLHLWRKLSFWSLDSDNFNLSVASHTSFDHDPEAEYKTEIIKILHTDVRHLMLSFIEKDESLCPVDNYDERQFFQILKRSLDERTPPSLAKFRSEEFQFRENNYILYRLLPCPGIAMALSPRWSRSRLH